MNSEIKTVFCELAKKEDGDYRLWANIRKETSYIQGDIEPIVKESFPQIVFQKLKNISITDCNLIILILTQIPDDFTTFKKIIKINKYNSAQHYTPKPILTIILDEEEVSSTQQERLKFLDSSIWYRSLNYSDKDFKSQLTAILAETLQYFDWKLYQSNVAREYCELYTRLFKEDYIIEIGGHGSNVTPFSPHSETEMKEKADEILKRLEEKDIIWDFLLIDDYVNSKLAVGKEGVDKTYIKKNKTEIIESHIGNKLSNSIEIKEQIEEGIAILRKKQFNTKKNESGENKKFDVILLDYLFSNSKPTKYGTELLEKITKDIDFSYGKGPFNRYWFFPVSVFSDAFLSDLQAKGLSYINEHWYLSRGADPVNTPQLFRYQLYYFLEQQVKTVDLESIEIFRFFLEKPIVLSQIAGNKYRYNVDEWAKKVFGIFIQRYSNMEYLRDLEPIKSKSAFIKSISDYLTKHRAKETYIIEHIRRLLYLLAYEVGHEWQIMSAELQLIQDKAYELYDKYKNETSENKKQMKNVLEQLNRIGRYINDLSDRYY